MASAEHLAAAIQDSMSRVVRKSTEGVQLETTGFDFYELTGHEQPMKIRDSELESKWIPRSRGALLRLLTEGTTAFLVAKGVVYHEVVTLGAGIVVGLVAMGDRLRWLLARLQDG